MSTTNLVSKDVDVMTNISWISTVLIIICILSLLLLIQLVRLVVRLLSHINLEYI